LQTDLDNDIFCTFKILNLDQCCLLCIMARELFVRKTPEVQGFLCKIMKSLPNARRLASHTCLKLPSPSSLESWGRGTGEIVLTRLSLKTN